MLSKFQKSALTVLSNGRRLVDEIEYLRYEKPPSTAYFLIILAQEELAKAFLFALVYRGIIPWGKHILRASQDHRCKQLLFLVMDYLNPEDDDFLKRMDIVVIHKQCRVVPRKISDAISILRYEKIGRWESNRWFWAEDPNWDSEALAVADGIIDRFKQDLIYVRLGRDGSVVNTPINNDLSRLEDEIDCAKRMAELVASVIDHDRVTGLDWEKVEEIFRLLFTESKDGKDCA